MILFRGSAVIVARVTYCGTDSEGFVIRFDFDVSISLYSPLLLSLREGLPPELKALRQSWTLSDSDDDIECYEDQSEVIFM